ncbi:unnamed protein product [Heligmosomoides polygyrus]|uniref:Secreted protein n=1 Tax=Heligmosomoides polygyrus TaxID=6339 RepID=A0A183G0Y9_HELPZ|nr:unnamed protein product [Heligmosomoides polygyrus]
MLRPLTTRRCPVRIRVRRTILVLLSKSSRSALLLLISRASRAVLVRRTRTYNNKTRAVLIATLNTTTAHLATESTIVMVTINTARAIAAIPVITERGSTTIGVEVGKHTPPARSPVSNTPIEVEAEKCTLIARSLDAITGTTIRGFDGSFRKKCSFVVSDSTCRTHGS